MGPAAGRDRNGIPECPLLQLLHRVHGVEHLESSSGFWGVQREKQSLPCLCQCIKCSAIKTGLCLVSL